MEEARRRHETPFWRTSARGKPDNPVIVGTARARVKAIKARKFCCHSLYVPRKNRRKKKRQRRSRSPHFRLSWTRVESKSLKLGSRFVSRTCATVESTPATPPSVHPPAHSLSLSLYSSSQRTVRNNLSDNSG
jgi:hypothetical protein